MPAFQTLCSTLTGIHRVDASLLRTIADRHGAALAGRFEDAHPPVRHPLVRAHPDTGAPSLYLCPMYLERVPELHPDDDHHPSVRRMRRCTTDGERPAPARRTADQAPGDG